MQGLGLVRISKIRNSPFQKLKVCWMVYEPSRRTAVRETSVMGGGTIESPTEFQTITAISYCEV